MKEQTMPEAEISNVEKELRQIANVEPGTDQSRQDYLKNLCRAVAKLGDDDIDKISTPGQEWYDAAVDCMNDNTDVPEIGETGPVSNGDAEAQAANGHAEPEEEPEAAEAAEEAPEPAPEPAEEKPKASGKSKKGKATAKGKAAQQDTAGKSKATADGATTKAQQAKAKRASKAKPAKQKPKDGRQTDSKDKFGLLKSSQRSKAATFFEKGATMREVSNSFDGNVTFYNLLKKLEDDGHHVSRDGHKIFLKHKDEVKA